jgi:hypothetical protein
MSAEVAHSICRFAFRPIGRMSRSRNLPTVRTCAVRKTAGLSGVRVTRLLPVRQSGNRARNEPATLMLCWTPETLTT